MDELSLVGIMFLGQMGGSDLGLEREALFSVGGVRCQAPSCGAAGSPLQR